MRTGLASRPTDSNVWLAARALPLRRGGRSKPSTERPRSHNARRTPEGRDALPGPTTPRISSGPCEAETEEPDERVRLASPRCPSA
jgi:hypothetical protein